MDYGHKETDKMLSELEARIDKEYRKANKEVGQKLDNYLKRFEKKDEMKRKALIDGTITRQEYNQWRVGQVMIGKRWEEMRDTLAQDLTNTNKIAASMINGHTPEVYALNHNYGTFEVEKGSLLNTSYTLYDRNTVERLIRDQPNLLPKAKVPIAADKRYNQQLLTSAVTQGILQGKSMNDIAKDIFPEIKSKANFAGLTKQKASALEQKIKNSAIRNARTMTTAAENRGRKDSYERAEKMGIKLKNQWVATLDGRTRHSHRLLDGEIEEVGEEFSNGCEYPGDPNGDPSEVYNCRCTLIAVVDGIDYALADMSGYNGKLGDMSYDEWKHEHDYEEESTPSHIIAYGKDISGSWSRRTDQFDFEIEDVINAQGFDGLPRVVSREEFDEAVKAANDGNGFIAQRTYSAADQETLNAYRDQLYNGKWYVDCSVGESHYGQGMYGTGTNGKSVNDSIRNTMNKYIEINSERITDYGDLQINVKSAVETFTVTPDAKFINYDDLRKLKEQEITELSSSGNYDKMNEIFNMDNGSYATIKGYDGITGVYNFVSKDNDDVIILNRTKVIFKGE